MAKLILLLLIAGSLALFAVGNLTPTSLVILGIRTQALPLAVWVLGSLLAGAATTVLLSGFSSLARGAAVRRASQPPRDRSPWTAARGDGPRPQSSAGRTSGRDDDWDRDPAAWDNWGEPSQPPRPPVEPRPQTEIRDRADEDWANWDNYENRVRGDSRQSRTSQSRTPRTESATNRQASSSASSPASGSASNPASSRVSDRISGRAGADSPNRAPDRSRDVYDAEYRVLIPPYSQPSAPAAPPPTPSTPPSPPPTSADDEDWGLDDEPQDRPR